MSSSHDETNQDGLDRRQFLARSTAAVALMSVSGAAILHTTEAWGLETKALEPEVMRMLLFGLALVGMMLYRPAGLFPAAARRRELARREGAAAR